MSAGSENYGRHVDYVLNEYTMRRQRQLGRVDDQGTISHLSDTTPAVAERRRQEIANDFEVCSRDLDVVSRMLMMGSYIFGTEPHTEADCPFADGPILPFVPGPPFEGSALTADQTQALIKGEGSGANEPDSLT